MKLIVVLVAILSKKFSLIPLWLHDDQWLGQYLGQLRRLGVFTQSDRAVQMALVCLPIILAFGACYWFLGDRGFGLVGFVFSILVLQFALGARDVEKELGEYLECWRSHQKEQYRQIAKERFSHGVWGASDIDLHRAVYGQVLQRHCYTLFTPIFWFWVLGPMGAVLSGVSALIARQGPGSVSRRKGSKAQAMEGESDAVSTPPISYGLIQIAGQMQEWLAWLPSRVMVLSFTVTGHFSTVWRPALESCVSFEKGTLEVLQECANAALDIKPFVADRDLMREQANVQMTAMQSLLHRTLGFWLVGLAVFTIFGLTY